MLTRVTLPSYTYHYAATEFGNIAYRETGKGAAAISFTAYSSTVTSGTG